MSSATFRILKSHRKSLILWSMEKIKYRLVFNRKKTLNKEGKALVQVEATLNQRKVYMTTNVYLKPEWWNKDKKLVVNHPQAEGLNLMLWQFVLDLQNVEIELWKRGTTPTLAMIKSCGKEVPDVTFKAFAKKMIDESDRSEKTKENLRSTVRAVCRFRQGLDFKDISYGFLKSFEQHLRDTGKSTNTVGKHMRQLRTIVNEAINHGIIKADDYPFRKYKIKSEKGHFEWLTPQELKRLENLKPTNKGQRHVLDAFLFCCYTGLRYSDFVRMKPDWMERIGGKPWLHFFTKKTHTEVRLPLSLLFGGKALDIIDKYGDIGKLARIYGNHDTNVVLGRIMSAAKIGKRATFHAARHTCATLLVYQGVPITSVQKILGHASLKTTQIYSEIMPRTVVKDLKNAVKKRNAV